MDWCRNSFKKFWLNINLCIVVLYHKSEVGSGYRETKATSSVGFKVALKIEEGWMKEDLFVRPDGRPMVFLMGEVRERDKVLNFWVDLC